MTPRMIGVHELVDPPLRLCHVSHTLLNSSADPTSGIQTLGLTYKFTS